MHVAINGWFANQPHTGSGQYLRHMLVHLPQDRAGGRFSLLIPGWLPEMAAVRFPGVAVVPVSLPRPWLSLPENLLKLWWEQVAAPWSARRLDADVLWVPYWAAPAWQPLPVVVTVHDLIPRLLPAYRGGLLPRLYTALVSGTARRSAAVLTVSQASARDVVTHLGIPGGRVHAVPHGPNWDVSASLEQEHLEAVRARYALPARFFLYLGGFDVRKNVAGILQAYARYLERGGDPIVQLVLAGKLPAVDTPFFPEPRRMAARLRIEEQVHFTGWVVEEDKPALYALATALVFPSHYEGFGMMVLEAMAVGCPVITSRA